METESQVISQALRYSTLPEQMRTTIRERIQSLAMERRIALMTAFT